MRTSKLHLLISLITPCIFASSARADIAIPTRTEIVFTVEGKPYRAEVEFTVECFGQMAWPANPPSEKIIGESKVFSFNGECNKYPCYINQGYNTNYRRIDYCNLSGVTSGRKFEITHFSDQPVGNCDYKNGEQNCRTEFALPKTALENH